MVMLPATSFVDLRVIWQWGGHEFGEGGEFNKPGRGESHLTLFLGPEFNLPESSKSVLSLRSESESDSVEESPLDQKPLKEEEEEEK